MSDHVTYAQTRRFLEMGNVEKLVFLMKFVVFVCGIGFVFPRLFSDGIDGKSVDASGRA